MDNINSCIYGFGGAASVGFGIGGLVAGSKALVGTSLVCAAALSIMALIQNSKADPAPTEAELGGSSHLLTFCTCASILGVGLTGIALGSNALIILALATAVLSVIQSDLALYHITQQADASLKRAREGLHLVRDGVNDIDVNNDKLERLLNILQSENSAVFAQVNKILKRS